MSQCIEVGSRITARRQNRKRLGAVGRAQYVCHHCDNPLCVNPEHTYLGNALTNNRDTARRRRHANQQREVGPCGHPLDGVRRNRNGSTKRYCLTCNAARTRAWRERVA